MMHVAQLPSSTSFFTSFLNIGEGDVRSGPMSDVDRDKWHVYLDLESALKSDIAVRQLRARKQTLGQRWPTSLP
jgi:hypothetical protein